MSGRERECMSVVRIASGQCASAPPPPALPLPPVAAGARVPALDVDGPEECRAAAAVWQLQLRALGVLMTSSVCVEKALGS